MYDVIIIGAGLAGLIAARELSRAGKNIRVLEARSRLGGRLFTQYFEDGSYADLGGQWIGPGHDHIYSLLGEYGLETFPTWLKGKNLLSLNQKRRSYRGLIPPLPVHELLSLHFSLQRIEKLAQKVVLHAPWKTPGAKHYDGITLESWARKYLPFRRARQLFATGVEAVFACSMADLSMLHAMAYIKSGNSFETLLNVDNGAQQDRIKGGVQPLLERIADEFRPAISLNSPVTAIIQEEDHVRVVTPQRIFEAKKIIIAIPPPAINHIAFTPSLPLLRRKLQERYFMGDVVKCYAFYKSPFWREQGLNGQAVSDSGLLTVTFDNSTPYDSRGILMSFSLADKARSFMELSPAERENTAITHFKELFGPEAGNYTRYIDKSMSEEIWSGGCYAAMLPPNSWTTVGKTWREAVGNIHWAGTETAEMWQGYMEGAARSGLRVVQEVLNG